MTLSDLEYEGATVGYVSCPDFLLSYCFLNGSSLVTLCSCKTVHNAVHIEPKQLKTTFEMSFQVSKFSAKRLLRLLITLVFFCILTCNTTLLSISVKVRNINVDLCVPFNEWLLTENVYLV